MDMDNLPDANFTVAVTTRTSSDITFGYPNWSNEKIDVRRSISWNEITANCRLRSNSPDLFTEDDETEETITPISPLSISQASNDWLPDSFYGNQMVASSSRQPERNDNKESRRCDEVFSSMDVAYDTQSVDLFSDCEQSGDLSQQRTQSPDLFEDSDDTNSEVVHVPVPENEIIDLTQSEGESIELIPTENADKNIIDLTQSQGESLKLTSREIAIPIHFIPPANPAQSSPHQVLAVGTPNGDEDSPNGSQPSQSLILNAMMRMECDPTILLERLLGSRFASGVPVSQPMPSRFNDDTTTVFSGDETSGCVLGDEAKEMLRKIENLIADSLTKLAQGKRLELTVRNRTDRSNCAFENEIFSLLPTTQAKCRRIKSTYLLSLIIYLLGEIYEMISMNRKCTLRELYYSDTEITEKQENVNEAVKIICCKLEVDQWQLGVMSSVKGLLAGRLKIFMPDNVIIDCSLHNDGLLLPLCTPTIERFETDAKYILLVEKDTVFKKLVEYDISKHFGAECILITGKGYPDTTTRMILKKLWDSHRLPIYALTDADPHGIEIMLTYRHGSLAMSNMSDALAVPAIRWIGILPTDIHGFGMKSIPMTGEDRRKLENLLRRPGLNDNIYRELQSLKLHGRKAEIEGLSGSSSDYLIDTYLREKFNQKIAI